MGKMTGHEKVILGTRMMFIGTVLLIISMLLEVIV